jgi:hypothetical protein
MESLRCFLGVKTQASQYCMKAGTERLSYFPSTFVINNFPHITSHTTQSDNSPSLLKSLNKLPAFCSSSSYSKGTKLLENWIFPSLGTQLSPLNQNTATHWTADFSKLIFFFGSKYI